MPDTLDPLILDLLEWLAAKPRPYAEVMDAWRTSCPRLTVWEDANDRGLLAQRYVDGQGPVVEVTPQGQILLAQSGRGEPPSRGLDVKESLTDHARTTLGRFRRRET